LERVPIVQQRAIGGPWERAKRIIGRSPDTDDIVRQVEPARLRTGRRAAGDVIVIVAGNRRAADSRACPRLERLT